MFLSQRLFNTTTFNTPKQNTESTVSSKKYFVSPKVKSSTLHTNDSQDITLKKPTSFATQLPNSSLHKFRKLKKQLPSSLIPSSQTVQEYQHLIPITKTPLPRRATFIDINENYDIYGQFGEKQTQANIYTQQEHIYKQCEALIKTFENELRKIDENKKENPKQKAMTPKEYLDHNFQVLSTIRNLTMQALINKANRKLVESIIHQIAQEVPKVKNSLFQVQTYYLLARILQNYKNPIFAISLFKSSKRISYLQIEQDLFLKAQMKAYRGLGECFITIKPQNSLIYFSKYLMCAWKLERQSNELEAYDFLGKYYFYVGDLSKANIFHSKSLNGDLEAKGSALVKLASAQIESIIKEKKKKEDAQKRSLVNLMSRQAEDEFAISSGEEIFEIQFKERSYKEKIIEKRQKFAIRDNPKFFRDDIKTRQEFKQANTNIRLKIEEFKSDIMTGSEVDLRKLKGISQVKSQNIGECKQRIFLQHLTPNRNLAIYQSLELNNHVIKSHEQPKEIAPFFEKSEQAKIKKLFNKFSNQTRFLMQWLSIKQTQLLGHTNKRRQGYMI